MSDIALKPASWPSSDEGEAHARKLIAAGVRTTCVRDNGTLHDFLMLNPPSLPTPS
jgi:acetyl esterase/lipase